jgi:hypothetical protein
LACLRKDYGLPVALLLEEPLVPAPELVPPELLPPGVVEPPCPPCPLVPEGAFSLPLGALLVLLPP